MSGRKDILRAKLKAACQEKRLQKWKEHFINLLGNPPEITDEPIQKIINGQWDVKLGQITKEELDVISKKIKNRKVACLDLIPSEVWKTRKFDVLLWLCNAAYK